MIQSSYPLTPGIAFPGMISDSMLARDIITGINTHATLAIPFGGAVARAAGGSSQASEPMEAITDLVRGILIHNLSHAPSQIEDAGFTFNGINVGAVKPKNTLAIMKKGRIWVICENGCTKGDRLHVRAVVAGAEIRGALRSAADGTDTKDCSGQGEWVSSASAGAIAELEVDFSNLPT